MGRRRRRVIKVVKKKLPSVFTCPRCGEEAVRVRMGSRGAAATVQCGSCGLKDEYQTTAGTQEVDVYCWFTDKLYGGTVPKERLVSTATATSGAQSTTVVSEEPEKHIQTQPVAAEVKPAKLAPPKVEGPATVPDFEFEEEGAEEETQAQTDETGSSERSQTTGSSEDKPTESSDSE